MTAIEAVVRRHDAYNSHDLDAFLEAHADDVLIATYPDELIGTGHRHLGMIFGDLFRDRRVSVERQSAIEADPYVVTQELVDYGDRTVRYVVLYEVRDDLIRSIRFLRD